MSTTAQVVPTGPYFGFTLSELETDLDRYKTARQQSGSRLIGSTINGQSFTFGPRGDWSLDEWQQNLQAAFYYMDPGRYPMQPPTNAAVAAFI